LNRSIKFAGVIFLLVIVAQSFITADAYSATYGVEIGDTVTMSYVGTKDNGEIFDQNAHATFTIDNSKLIPGFVDGIVGMKIGETKNFVVPPARGYKTGELAGINLNFKVTIISVAGYDPSSTTAVDDTFSRTFMGWTIAILLVVFGAFGFMAVKNNFVPSLTKCIICGEPYEGTCANCSASYCRKDFGRRCQECGHKTFIPRKK